ILKKFITEIENLVDKKVKLELLSKMVLLKRRNRTLIEAARTMALVVKPHNKTPYELFRGRIPDLSFMKPFECHVTILNTLDRLGKFDGKADEGDFVGYSMSSKAFRATLDESMLWHRRLGHINFKNIKKLVKDNLVRGLPSKHFENDQTCVSCLKVVNAVKVNKINAVKALACWVWRPTKPNGASITLKRHNYNDGHPHQVQEDQGYIDSGCSRHMTKNISYLLGFKEFNGGYVTFWGGANGGRIIGKGTLKIGKLDFEDVYFVKELDFNLLSVSQMCDKKNSVLFTDTGCFVLSPDFNLTDESQGHPHQVQEDQGYIDSGCSRHITKNISYLLGFKEFNGGYVTFWGGANGGRIIGKGTLKTGIKRELSVARTPQQNVNTACYVQNRALVVKPHNKTPYELFRGRTPDLSFIKPFECHVTILNTLDRLGKFDGKADEGDFVGYSMSSKAFRVYNIRTRRVEENLHIEFLENKPIVVCARPKWLFDIDMLIESMNYVPVITGIGNAGRATPDQTTKEEEGIDYDEVFARVARIEAIRLFLAYASFIGFMVYQIYVNSDFLYERIEEEDLDQTLCMQYVCVLDFKSLLRDFLFELVAYTDSDYAGASLDRKTTTRGFQFLGSRLISWQCKKQTVIATSTTKAKYVAATSYYRQVLWI
nr:retrovirus-related Pol polyprotein from transposon TNT 1-94 [Tanacetum cinerariifolium]